MAHRSLVSMGEIAAFMAGMVWVLAGARHEEKMAAEAAAKKRSN
jgi:hypothetical protein